MNSISIKKWVLVCTLSLHHGCQAPWPFSIFENRKPFTLIIEASGDAINPGRTIGNSFENAISFNIAQHIKQISDSTTAAKIYLNRTPTEIITPLANAQFANKLNADLYLSIHCYHHTHAQPRITLYQYSYHEPTIFKKGSLGFIPADKVNGINESQTHKWANELKMCLAGHAEVVVHGVYKMPFKPLMGIEASAIGIEIGMASEQDIPLITALLSDCIELCIRKDHP